MSLIFIPLIILAVLGSVVSGGWVMAGWMRGLMVEEYCRWIGGGVTGRRMAVAS